MFDRALRSLLPLAALAAAVTVGPAQGQSWRTIKSARQVQDRQPMEVHIQYGAGELRVRPTDQPMLYEMDMRYDEEHFTPLSRFDAAKRTLELGVKGRDGHRRMSIKEGSRATIALSRQVPFALDLDFGAGEAAIDLGGIALRSLEVSTGASETTIRFDAPNPIQAEHVSIEAGAANLRVTGLGNTRAERIRFHGGVGATLLDFTGAWTRDATASVDMGIGSVTLRFPRGLGVRLNKDSFLTSFDGEGLIKRGNSFYSPNWESASHRLTIDVDAAFGSIEVEWTG
jgi:hypothetical protein